MFNAVPYVWECVSYVFLSRSCFGQHSRVTLPSDATPTFGASLGCICAGAESVDSHLWTPYRTMYSWHSKAPVPVADTLQRGVSQWVHTHTHWDSRDDNSHSTWVSPCAEVVLASHTCWTLLYLVIYIQHSHCTCLISFNYINIIYCTMLVIFVYIYLNASSSGLPPSELNKV